MKTIIAIILTLGMASATNYNVVLTEIYEDDQIKISVSYDGNVKEKIMHSYDFNNLDELRLSKEIEAEKSVGKFTKGFKDIDGNTYYQFKSNDDSTWWTLTETEIGFKPSAEKEYVLLYSNNGTTAEGKPCDCLPEWECECEVYDDIFFGIFESNDI